MHRMLKTAPQLVGLSHCDAPWLTPKSQQLLEEFWEAQGSPNGAEITLLARACRTRRDHVKEWCKLHPGPSRRYKLNLITVIAKKKRLNILRKEYISQWFSHRLRQRRTARRRKPLMRHWSSFASSIYGLRGRSAGLAHRGLYLL